ncbi:MAG TPA: eL32 family ribosomal protein, partial [Candidatus Nanoarchaeia archaeon]|nr:eL32 family ribosomal protein [Candidatus Nanoarchaeia archaeon]
GLTREGLVPIMVHRPEDVDKLQQPFIIAHTVGLKKRVLIVKKALEKKLRILNVKDLQAFLTSVEQSLKLRKQGKSTRRSAKNKSQEDSKKAAAKSEKKEESVEEKEQREKEEKKKVLEAKA